MGIKQPMRGYLAIVGAFLIHLTLSTLYILGNLNTYVISYQRQEAHQEHLTYGDSIWILATAIGGQGALMFLSGYLQGRFGGRWTCVLGCSIYTLMNAVTYFTVQKGFVGLVLTLGFLSNLGMGIAYGASLAVGMQWFPESNGFASGVIVGGFGLGAFIFNQVSTVFLNPYNLSPNEEGYFTDDRVLSSVPNFFLLLAGIHTALQLMGVCLLFSPPKQDSANEVQDVEKFPIQHSHTLQRLQFLFVRALSDMMIQVDPKKRTIGFTQQQQSKVTEDKELVKKMEENCGKTEDLNVKQMLRRREFYILWVTFALNIQTIQFFNSYYKTFGQSFITDDYFLSLIGSCGSVVNCFGRIVWGRVMDKFSYKNCMLAMLTLTAALMFSLIVASEGGKITFVIWVLAIYFVIGGTFALLPAATLQVFGSKHHGTNYGIIFTAPAISSIVGAFLIARMIRKLTWFQSFCIFGVLNEIAFFITAFFPNNPK